MTRRNVAEAREEFEALVNRAADEGEPTVVSRQGKDVAVILPLDDLRLLQELAEAEMDRRDVAEAMAALREAEETGTVSLEEARRELGLDKL